MKMDSGINAFLEQMNDELTRRLELIEGLSADYETVFHADLIEDRIQPYRISGLEWFQFGRDLQVRPFTGFADEYVDRWVHPEDKESFRRDLDLEYIKKFLAVQKSYHINYRVLHDGEPEYVQAVLANVSPEEGVTQIMFGCRTVDEEVRREKARTAMLEDALRKAELAGEARNTFLSNMSHDMRTPMNAIVGFTALARRHLNDPERLTRDLDRISEAGAHLLRLVNDVLEVSWLETGQIRIEETACSLPALAREVFEDARSQAGEKRLEILPVEIGHPDVLCDEPKLRHALARLASGALRCVGEAGRVELSIREGDSSAGGYGAYTFTAECFGLTQPLERALNTFQRREVTAAEDAEGFDLGLNIVKRVIELMGGCIRTESLGADRGRFAAALDLRIQEKRPPAPAAENGERRVLVVEDNELNREIAVDLLEEAEFLVETAENGAVAVEMVKNSRPGYYSLVLMDLRMPVMDGHAAARAIRALEDPGLSAVPIVALSANTFDEDRKLSAESGMNAHMAKPLDVDRLMELIASLTGGAAACKKPP